MRWQCDGNAKRCNIEKKRKEKKRKEKKVIYTIALRSHCHRIPRIDGSLRFSTFVVMEDKPNPVGRPSDYTPELLKKARDYNDNCPDTVHSIEGICDHLDIARTTAYRWAEEEGKEEFKYILDKTLKKQAKALINNGLDGTFNSTIAKLILTKHGYNDKIEQTGEGNLTIKIVREQGDSDKTT